MIFEILENVLIRGLNSLISPARVKKSTESSRILIGRAAHPYHPNHWEEITLEPESLLRHVYALGGTGMGKTKFTEFLSQRIMGADHGLCVIDPHGDLTQNILKFLCHQATQSEIDELGERLILIEPFDRGWAIGFNPLDSDESFAASLQLTDIFRRFWGDGYWGPRMDELFRNGLVTLCENNLTLFETRPLLTHPEFRARLVENVSFGEVRDYWNHRYNPLSEKMQSMYREPVLNKITAFIADPSIYRILCQSRSTVDFREAMDQGKWILLNLSKGHLGENMRLLGTLFLNNLKQAAFSRIDIPEETRRPFFVFADEFQSFMGGDVATIETVLSESRKFRLGLCISHQNLDQIPQQLRQAILGNVGTEVFFRLSNHDAAIVSSEMSHGEKHLIEKRLIDFKVGEAYLKIKGQKARLFKTVHVPSLKVPERIVDSLKQASFRNWAVPVHEVEEEIAERRRMWEGGGALDNYSLIEPVKEIADDTLPAHDSFEEGQNEW